MRDRKFGIGQPLKRVEDVRLVSGRGRYTSDSAVAADLRAVFLRSPHGHAKFTIGDLAAARAMPGVRAIYTLADFAAMGGLPCMAPVQNSDKTNTPLKPFPVMADKTVEHVGDIVAMVVADTYAQARDAAEAIEVDYDILPAVVDMEAALRPGAPLVFPGAPGNVAYDAHVGDKARTDAVFARAPRRVSIRIVNPRVVANYMEPRSAVGEYDAATDRFTLHASSQGVHSIRDIIAKTILKISPDRLRVLTEDVGGVFGRRQGDVPLRHLKGVGGHAQLERRVRRDLRPGHRLQKGRDGGEDLGGGGLVLHVRSPTPAAASGQSRSPTSAGRSPRARPRGRRRGRPPSCRRT